MDTSPHNLNTLFAQLGLSNSNADIETFIKKHKPLDPHIELADAPWWNPGQTAFLRDAIEEDAEWAYVVDELNDLLR